MNFCSIDIPNKTLTLLEEKDGHELLNELTDLWKNHSRQPFPLDYWMPGKQTNSPWIVRVDDDFASVDAVPALYMCETEEWRVINSDKIQNVMWVDWRNG